MFSKKGRAAAKLPSFLVAGLLLLAGTAAAEETTHDAEPALEFINLDLLDSRDGYAIPADSSFLPGETIHVYFQLRGYQVTDDYRVKLEYRLEALDPGGKRFYGAEGGRFDTELAPQDDQWMPVVRYSPEIPQHAGGGIYEIKIEVTDQNAEEVIRTTLPIRVDGESVETSDELTIRDFGFTKADGGTALSEPVYRAGEEIWAAFYITGYDTREDNTFEVESDVKVLDDEGETMFEFDARSEKGNPFYPRLWLPAKFRLDLDKTIPPGRYLVVLNVHDKIGESTFTHRRSFEVR